MFRYFARLSEKHALPVYPVVVFSYDAPRRPEPSRYVVTFPGFTPLTFRYRVIQLNRLPWRVFVNRPSPVASALMAKMRIAPRDRSRVKIECLRLLLTPRLDPARMQIITGFVDQYLRLSAAEERRYDQQVRTLPPEEGKGVMQITTSWMERGLEQGRQEGRQEGMAELAQVLLRRRFPSVPAAITARVARLSAPDLIALGQVVSEFADVADLATWLDERQSA